MINSKYPIVIAGIAHNDLLGYKKLKKLCEKNVEKYNGKPFVFIESNEYAFKNKIHESVFIDNIRSVRKDITEEQCIEMSKVFHFESRIAQEFFGRGPVFLDNYKTNIDINLTNKLLVEEYIETIKNFNISKQNENWIAIKKAWRTLSNPIFDLFPILKKRDLERDKEYHLRENIYISIFVYFYELCGGNEWTLIICGSKHADKLQKLLKEKGYDCLVDILDENTDVKI